MPDIVWSPRASGDIAAIHDELFDKSRSAASALLDDLRRALDNLAVYPAIGPARPDLRADMRSLVVDRYLVVYRERPNRIEIITIFDGRRDPAALRAIMDHTAP